MGKSAKRARREVTGVLEAIGSGGADPGSFARLGVAELPRLVSSELTTLSVCDLTNGRRRVVGNPGQGLSDDDIAAFDRHFFEHPLVQFHSSHPNGGAHRISDSMDAREFHASALYNDYYRRIGIDHAVAIPLYVDPGTLVSFVLNRAGRDFSDEDLALFEQLRGWLAAMYRNAVALKRASEAIAQLEKIAAADDWAIVRVDAHRRVRDLSPQAAEMLAGAFPDARPRTGALLPHPIDAWLRRAADEDAPRLALAPLVLAGRQGSVIVRALPELASDAAWVLLVRGGVCADGPAVALTGREKEVLRWVAAGKTDRQIASILGTSSRTVQKHLEHIYVKLGVENRTAAAMRALRLDGSAEASEV
jgi:DNA-binding CsgD family transcriptional regulator/GAF domain-containing protein